MNTDVQITGLKIISLNIDIITCIKPESNNAEKVIKEKINFFINNLNKKMGQNLIYVQLLKEIEYLKCVEKVNKLELKVINSKIPNSPNNDIIIPANAVYVIKNLDVSCIINLGDV